MNCTLIVALYTAPPGMRAMLNRSRPATVAVKLVRENASGKHL